MPSLSQIIQVTISRLTKSITRAGFGKPMILGLHTRFAEIQREYEDIDGVAADFQTSDAEYKAAVSVFSQNPRPPKIMIGRRTALVAQVVDIVITAVNSFSYVVTINGVPFTFLSDVDATVAEVRDGLIAAINAGSEPVTASASGSNVRLTADVAGDSFSFAVSANLVASTFTANHGVKEDIQAVVDSSNDWYCLLLTSRVDADILNAAADIELRKKIFGACTSDATAKDATLTDVGAKLAALNYDRTFTVWSAGQATYPEAGWAGQVLPLDPGSETWKFKSISGSVADDNLTVTQQTNLLSKNYNLYETYAGVPIFHEGMMASGEFIDVIRFVDWLEAQIQEAQYKLFIDNPKIPFTDNGIAIIEGSVREQLTRGVQAGGLAEDPAFEITVPKAADVSAADKADRKLPDVVFTATLAGAIHKTIIEGTLTL